MVNVTATDFFADDSNETPETPPADLLKLVEKWKVDLSEKYKIQQDRFIVLFAGRSNQYAGNSLETWIVPSGGLLPDPDAEPAENSADETESGEVPKPANEVQPEENKLDKVKPDMAQPLESHMDKARPDQALPVKAQPVKVVPPSLLPNS